MDTDQVCAEDVAGIIYYIVSYIYKGVESLISEKNMLCDSITYSQPITGDIKGVKRVTKHILNQAAKQRTISK